MTTKKSKNRDLTHKTDLKYRSIEAKKKNQNTKQNTKRVETFLPVPSEGKK
jgi:hypothetical protein